jgi:hypothetical protein
MSSEGQRPDGSGAAGREGTAQGRSDEDNRGLQFAGSLSGGAGFGDHGSALIGPSHSGDRVVREFLDAARQLRHDLTRFAADDDLAALDEALAEVEDDITLTGHTEPGRLHRLRHRLAAAQWALTSVASASTVAHLLELLAEGPSGHTPPGPSTGSDDDEWPEADG